MNLLVRKNVWIFISHQTVQSCPLNLLVLMAQELKGRNCGVIYLHVYPIKELFVDVAREEKTSPVCTAPVIQAPCIKLWD